MGRRRKSPDAAPAQVIEEKVFDVGAYVRLSAVDRKQKGDSIETQQAIISSYIAERPDLALRETYIDNGIVFAECQPKIGAFLFEFLKMLRNQFLFRGIHPYFLHGCGLCEELDSMISGADFIVGERWLAKTGQGNKL